MEGGHVGPWDRPLFDVWWGRLGRLIGEIPAGKLEAFTRLNFIAFIHIKAQSDMRDQ